MNASKSTTILAGTAISAAVVYFLIQRLSKSQTPSKTAHAAHVTTRNDRENETEEMDHAGMANRVLRKSEAVIQGRTSRVIIVVERCTDDHNYSAILRTAEALGIQHVWLIDPVMTIEQQQKKYQDVSVDDNEDEDEDDLEGTSRDEREFASHEDKVRYEHGKFAKRATEWITLREFKTTKECIDALRKDNRTIWATDLSQKARCLTAETLDVLPNGSVIPERLAIIMGTESVGVTEEMLNAADLRVYLPLRGFADSLNLSVAAALVMQQIFHLDPTVIASLTEEEKHELRSKWYPKMVAGRSGSASIKKELRKIASSLREIDQIKEKLNTTKSLKHLSEDEKASNKYQLSEAQQLKLSKEASLLARESEIKDKIWNDSQRAVQDAIYNPPKPLTDVRRCDEHRTAFVGSSVRKANEQYWKGMAATANNAGQLNANSVPKVKADI